MIENLETSQRLVLHWRLNPVQAAKDIFDVDLEPHQRISLNLMWFNDVQTNILSRGTGKCVAGDTLVLTDEGLLRIEEVGQRGTIVRQEHDSELRERSLGVWGVDQPVLASHWYDDGLRAGLSVTTRFGYHVSGTKNHTVVCWESGHFIEKRLEQIVPGDCVVVQRGQKLFGKSVQLPTFIPSAHHGQSEIRYPQSMSEDLAYVLGLLTGDGTCGYERFVELTSADPELLQHFDALAMSLFGRAPRPIDDGVRCPSSKLNGKYIRRFLAMIGVDLCGARDKRVPQSIMRAPAHIVRSFLQGLFDTDGGCDKRGCISLGLSSSRLIREVHILLANFGVIGKLRRKESVDAWEIDITGEACDVFVREIGFRLQRKVAAYRGSRPAYRNTNRDTVPEIAHLLQAVKAEAMQRGIVIWKTVPAHQKLYEYIANQYEPSYASLTRILNALPQLAGFEPYDRLVALCHHRPFFDRVLAVSPFVGRVYDLVVPDGHLFTANAIVQHNTFLMGLCASLEGILKPGHRIGLIGPSFRQSKLVWDEVDKLYRKSPLFQQSVLKEPAITPEKCYLKFHAAEGKNSTVIEALPLGSDGGKIRGARYFSTYIDEAAQVEKEILDVVVRGFGATSANPVERANFMAQQKRLLAEGLITQDQILKPPSNKEIFSTTAFYQYNHSYERLCEVVASLQRKYKTAQKRGQDLSKFMFMGSPLNSGQIPYRVMSDGKEGLCAFTCMDPREGFMDMDSIRRAKRQMSNYKFLMEYNCARSDTPIVTSRGLKPISQIQVGDLVLTHRGRFRRVTELLINEYDGPMVELGVKGCNQNLHITANHPFWQGGDVWMPLGEVRNATYLANLTELSGCKELLVDEWVNGCLYAHVAGVEYVYPRPSGCNNRKRGVTVRKSGNQWRVVYWDISGKRRYRELGSVTSMDRPAAQRKAQDRFGMLACEPPAAPAKSRRVKSDLPRRIPINRDLGLIMGWYAAEGSVGAGGRQVQFALDGHCDTPLTAFVDELKGALERVFSKPVHVHQNGAVAQVYINSRLIAGLLSALCPGVSHEKVLASDVLFSNAEFLRGFLTGYWHGDGCMGQNSHSAVSVSPHLLTQIRLVLSYFGIAASFGLSKEAGECVIQGRLVSTRDAYRLCLNGDRQRLTALLQGTTPPPSSGRFVMNDGQKTSMAVWHHHIYRYTGTVYNLEVDEDHSYTTHAGNMHNCFFPPDSEGFFRRSLLDSVRARSDFGPIFEPRPGCLYTMGVDPARSDDNFAIAIFEIDPSAEEIRLVRVLAFNKKSFPEMHKRIRELIRIYKMKYFQMDAGGGGTTIRDLLSDPSSCPAGERLILEQDFDEHRTKTGDRYLGPLVQFSSYEWVQNANFNLKSGLEHKRLAIAAKSPVPGQVYKSLEDAEMYDEADEEIEAALTEWSSIVTTAAGARMHWDTPTKTMRKDRYSAILIGFDAAERVMALHRRPKVLAAGFWG